MSYVLDAHALTVYFEKELGHEEIQSLLTEAGLGRKPLLLTTVNWGEVFYVTWREHGREAAEQIARIIEEFPIEIVSIDRSLARGAAIFKTSRKVPYADCFAAALAKERKATLVTGDKDFKQLESEIKILWL